MPACGPQGLRFSHRCCGVSGLAGAGGLAPGGVAARTAGRPNTLGACAAAKPGFSGAAAGAATWPFDFAIAAAWAGFCCGWGTGLGGARGTGILMGLAVEPLAPARLALLLGWALGWAAIWSCCWRWVLIPAQTASLTNWIAVCTYVLIAIAKKRLHLPNSLHEILQILSLTMFETTPINQLLTPPDPDKSSEFEPQQLSLL